MQVTQFGLRDLWSTELPPLQLWYQTVGLFNGVVYILLRIVAEFSAQTCHPIQCIFQLSYMYLCDACMDAYYITAVHIFHSMTAQCSQMKRFFSDLLN